MRAAIFSKPYPPLPQARLMIAVPSYRALFCGQGDAGAGPRGAPALLVLTGSGAKACDLLRLLPDFGKRVKVAKLFAKHIKVGWRRCELEGSGFSQAVPMTAIGLAAPLSLRAL